MSMEKYMVKFINKGVATGLRIRLFQTGCRVSLGNRGNIWNFECLVTFSAIVQNIKAAEMSQFDKSNLYIWFSL